MLLKKVIQMKAPNAATEKESNDVAVDDEKEHDVSETEKEVPLKASLICPLPLKESDPDLLISHVNQLLARASAGKKEWDGFTYGVNPTGGLHSK